MYANGEKTKMSAEQIYEDGELYIPIEDAKKAFNAEISMTGNDGVYNGTSFTLEKAARTVNGITYVPITDIAKNVMKKQVFHHAETGLIIISDNEVRLNTDDWKYMWERDFNKMTVLNDIDFLNNFMVNERPDGETLLNDAYKTIGNLNEHPRIMIRSNDVERMRGTRHVR